ncbi:MAG TPA: ferritin-like domain-containing protein [Acidimicrobiia bacterium]|nr:ferritin-like domain-containing protein [Acidimicrobiia bacterium]
MTRYKEICGRLDYGDLDLPAAFVRHPLPPDLLRIVGYMHDVEQHTTCYMRNLLNTKAHDDPEITEFLTLWNFEEHWHGEALADILRAHGEPGGAPRVAAMRQRVRNRISNSPLVWGGISSVTKHFLAVHMTFGVINEWTTQAGYARLAALAEHDVLSELLRRIKRQEGRHIDYYLTQARRYLGVGSGAQRTARLILRTLWRPVGATVMPEPDTAHVIRTLFGGDQGRDVAARIDRRIDNLPGLDGMALMDGVLRRYAA